MRGHLDFSVNGTSSAVEDLIQATVAEFQMTVPSYIY
jgi:hypothetical protein